MNATKPKLCSYRSPGSHFLPRRSRTAQGTLAARPLGLNHSGFKDWLGGMSQAPRTLCGVSTWGQSRGRKTLDTPSLPASRTATAGPAARKRSVPFCLRQPGRNRGRSLRVTDPGSCPTTARSGDVLCVYRLSGAQGVRKCGAELKEAMGGPVVAGKRRSHVPMVTIFPWSQVDSPYSCAF